MSPLQLECGKLNECILAQKDTSGGGPKRCGSVTLLELLYLHPL